MNCTCQNIQFDTKHDMFWSYFSMYELILPIKGITLNLTFDLSTHLNYKAKCVFLDFRLPPYIHFDDFIQLRFVLENAM